MEKIVNKKIIIHVGAPKAASTYLQSSIFPYLKDVKYFRCLFSAKFNREKGDFFSLLNGLLVDFSVFGKNLENLENIDELKQEIYKNINSIEESMFLFSQEIFFQKPNVTQLFKELFPDAKIIIIIREQTDWLESKFSQLAKSGGNWETSEILKKFAFNCNWLEIYQHYTNYFGKENVLILPFEKLKCKEKEFLNDIYNFIGVENFYPDGKQIFNKGYSRAAIFITKLFCRLLTQRKKNQLRDYLEKNADKYLYWLGSKNFIDKKHKELIRLYYENSNTELSELTGLDLEKYGYAVNINEHLKKYKRINFQKYIDKLAVKYKNKRIIVYGAGDFFNFITKNYDLSKLNIIGISDKKFHNFQNEFYMNYHAISPCKISEHNPDVIFSGFYDSYITTQVKNLTKKPDGKDFDWEELNKVNFIDTLRLL